MGLQEFIKKKRFGNDPGADYLKRLDDFIEVQIRKLFEEKTAQLNEELEKFRSLLRTELQSIFADLSNKQDSYFGKKEGAFFANAYQAEENIKKLDELLQAKSEEVLKKHDEFLRGIPDIRTSVLEELRNELSSFVQKTVKDAIPVIKQVAPEDVAKIATSLVLDKMPRIEEEKPDKIVEKINEAKKKVAISSIDGLIERLDKIVTAIKKVASERGGGGGGGMGNVQHETKSVSSATTSITTNSKIAGAGYAIWAFYQGQNITRGTHFSVNSDYKTLPLLFTPQDATYIDLIYIRG